MRKYFSLGLAVLLALSMGVFLIACGKAEAPAPAAPTTIGESAAEEPVTEAASPMGLDAGKPI